MIEDDYQLEILNDGKIVLINGILHQLISYQPGPATSDSHKCIECPFDVYHVCHKLACDTYTIYQVVPFLETEINY